ncbi:HAD family hydrolase [Pseudoprimorskyibacter insulae]|uniref:Fructose-1-phosphate phosphatase YqaB n=1 Tax=Pseudoprimorskyibacter insulae TaxID=1695997 RepID=A0A2R8AWC7_9RHOB|nr:HAD-IA family hydrolase [Pseudoprimorskyibacter insulae]SPF80351.1 Fructose-1-phosphate phosphatase YqaB [Pseudoprimorskyibacter insulae]
MPQTKALLFDLDGTLLHSDPLHVAVFIEQFAENGLTIDAEYYLDKIHGRHNRDIYTEHFPDQDPDAMADDKEARFRDLLGGSAKPMPGLVALLDLAEAKGWPMAVVTNAPRQNALAMLQAIGLKDRLPTLVIGDECDRGKPAPDPYLQAMNLLGLAPDQCIAFEDSPSGVQAAAAAGAFTIGVRSSLNDAALRAAGAHQTIQDFNDTALAALLGANEETIQ